MPLRPHVVAQFTVGPVCPNEADLDAIKNAFLAAVTGVSDAAESHAVCRRRRVVATNVVSIGIWVDSAGFSDAQLRAELAATDLLTRGQTAALLVGADLIKLQVDAAFTLPRKMGRTTLTDVDVTFASDVIETEVKGRVDVPIPLAPDVSFTYTVRERLSLNPPGTDPPLRVQSSTDVETGLPSVLGNAFLIALLSPLLGAITIFAADPLAEQFAPDVAGPGGQVASNWPSEVLTQIAPPLLPGKFTLAWSEVTVDETGVRTLGTFTPAVRQPRAAVSGPRRIVIREELGTAQATYRIATSDLRPPLNIAWTVTGAGRAAGAAGASARSVLFRPGSRSARIGARVTDADGLSGSARADVAVSVRDAPPGTSPL